MNPLEITLLILLVTIIAFVSGKVPFSVISTGIILALILTGIKTPAEAFGGFINTNVVMFVAMFVIGAGLTKTPLIDKAQSLVIRYKDNMRIDIVKPVGWPRSGKTLSDTDMKYILRRMEKYGISSEKKIESAIRIVANENRYHPIRDYLNSLKWDGTERIAHVLHHFLGAAEDEYTCEAMKIFLLGAIKRVFQPGCKFETMLCLVGGQGCGSPVATSKCCKHFEAPTEPTGETGKVQLFSAAGSQGRVVLG